MRVPFHSFPISSNITSINDIFKALSRDAKNQTKLMRSKIAISIIKHSPSFTTFIDFPEIVQSTCTFSFCDGRLQEVFQNRFLDSMHLWCWQIPLQCEYLVAITHDRLPDKVTRQTHVKK